MKSRSGLTLLEILVAMLVMAIGLISIASLFPVGIASAIRADRDTRAAVLAMAARSEILARGYIERLAGDNTVGATGTDFFVDPDGAGTTYPDISGNTHESYALVIDPVGGLFWALQDDRDDRHIRHAAPFNGGDAAWTLGGLPRFPLFRDHDGSGHPTSVFPTSLQTIDTLFTDSVLRFEVDARNAAGKATTLQDGFEVAGSADDIVFKDVDVTGAVDTSAPQEYDRNYTWMAVVQRPQANNKRVYLLRIAVFRNRELSLEAERMLGSTSSPADPDPTHTDPDDPTRINIRWSKTDDPLGATQNLDEREAPTVRVGAYMLDAHPLRGFFYRITEAEADEARYDSGASAGNEFYRWIKLETAIRKGGGPATNAVRPIIMPGLVSVFESTVTID